MCRFMVYKGLATDKLPYWLLNSDNSLLKQSISDESRRPNPDGWGVVCRDRDKLQVFKNTLPAFQDDKFAASLSKIRGEMVFAHIRRRSQGPVLMENTHPFVHQERWVFMHNGNIPNFEYCKEQMSLLLTPEVEIKTGGTTDSEFLFKYFLHLFEQKSNCDVFCAMNIVKKIISKLAALTQENDQHLLALNFVLTDGNFVVGFRRNRSLHYASLPEGILIASEPVDGELRWNEVPENHFILWEEAARIKLVSSDLEFAFAEL
ncbi:MAG: class II glutamine amidotransferase [Calditrichia bacterium]